MCRSVGTHWDSCFQHIRSHDSLDAPLARATQPVVLPEGERTSTQTLQETFRHVRVVIIDEMSMVGRRMLRALDDRLRQAKGCMNKPYGGLSVFFCGDFGQLPPVSDFEMFSMEKKGGTLSAQGMQTWRACTHSLELTVNHRQKGGGAAFRDALWRLRCGELTMEDYELFAARGEHICAAEGFEDAPYLVATHELEAAHNLEKLVDLGAPVFAVRAVHTGGKKAAAAGDQDAGGLSKVALLAKGSVASLGLNLVALGGS